MRCWQKITLCSLIYFFWGCNTQKDIEVKICRVSSADILQNDTLKSIDSLLNSNYILKGLNGYKKISESTGSFEERSYILYKINKSVFIHNIQKPCEVVEFQPFPILKEKNELVECFKILSDYYTSGNRIDQNKINKFVLHNPKFENDLVLKAEISGDLGFYYYYDGYKPDSSLHYYDLSFDIFDKMNLMSLTHLWNYRAMSLLQLGYRNDHLALYYIKKPINQIPDGFNLEPQLKHIFQAHEAFYLFRMDRSKESNKIFELLIREIPIESCYLSIQEVLRLFLVYKMSSGNSVEVDQLFEKLTFSVDAYGDHCNFNKILGDWYYMKKEYKKALGHMKKAYQYIFEKHPLNTAQYFSITYLLKNIYLQLKQFDEALQIVSLEVFFPYGKIASPFDKDKLLNFSTETFYHFISLTSIAEILFDKYLHTGNNIHLYDAQLFIQKADSLMVNDIKSYNDVILENVFQYSKEIYEIGSIIEYNLFKESNNEEHLFNYLYFQEKNKSRILFRDLIVKGKDPLLLSEEKVLRQNLMVFQQKQELDSIYRYHKLLENHIGQYKEKMRFKFNTKTKEQLINIVRQSFSDSIMYIDLSVLKGDWYIFTFGSKEKNIRKVSPDPYVKYCVEKLKNLDRKTSLDSIQKFSTILSNQLGILNLTKFNQVVYTTSDQFSGLNLELLGRGEKMNFRFLIEDTETSYIESLYLLDRKGKINVSGIDGIFFSDNKTLVSSPLSLKEMPGNIIEKNYIQAYFQKTNLLSGVKCTKKNFYTMIENSNSNILHISTHGIGNSNNVLDVLLLFRNNQKADTLYGYELLNLNNVYQLVILSSCQTGLGTYVQGEGNYSLAKYFYHNGTQKVIIAQWNLDDTATGLLVNKFYYSLSNGENYSESLRSAKLSLREEFPNFSHPYYWGAIF